MQFHMCGEELSGQWDESKADAYSPDEAIVYDLRHFDSMGGLWHAGLTLQARGRMDCRLSQWIDRAPTMTGQAAEPPGTAHPQSRRIYQLFERCATCRNGKWAPRSTTPTIFPRR